MLHSMGWGGGSRLLSYLSLKVALFGIKIILQSLRVLTYITFIFSSKILQDIQRALHLVRYSNYKPVFKVNLKCWWETVFERWAYCLYVFIMSTYILLHVRVWVRALKLIWGTGATDSDLFILMIIDRI